MRIPARARKLLKELTRNVAGGWRPEEGSGDRLRTHFYTCLLLILKESNEICLLGEERESQRKSPQSYNSHAHERLNQGQRAGPGPGPLCSSAGLAGLARAHPAPEAAGSGQVIGAEYSPPTSAPQPRHRPGGAVCPVRAQSPGDRVRA